jgi:hypothetical protein
MVLVTEGFKPGKDPVSRLVCRRWPARPATSSPRRASCCRPTAPKASRRRASCWRRRRRLGKPRAGACSGVIAGVLRPRAGPSWSSCCAPAGRRPRVRRAVWPRPKQLCLRHHQVQARRPRAEEGGGRRGRCRRRSARPSTRPAPRAGIEFAANWATCPPTTPRPRGWATRPEAGQGARLQVRGAGPQGSREARHGLVRRVAQGLGRAAALHRAALPGRAKARRRWCWSARASPSTPAASPSSRGRDGRDEVRHVRRRQRAGHLPRARRTQAEAQRGRPHPRCENMNDGRPTSRATWSPA